MTAIGIQDGQTLKAAPKMADSVMKGTLDKKEAIKKGGTGGVNNFLNLLCVILVSGRNGIDNSKERIISKKFKIMIQKIARTFYGTGDFQHLFSKTLHIFLQSQEIPFREKL